MHANTTVLGRNCLLIQDFDKTVSVTGWDASAGATECRTVSGVVAYDHPVTGQAYMLVFHQAINLESMDNHLICPMQCRVNRVEINDTPKIFVKRPTECSHAIVVDDPVAPDVSLVILLQLEGVTSVFLVRTSSRQEYENLEFVFEMTGESLDWEPHDPDLAQQKSADLDLRGHVHDVSSDVIARGRRLICSVSCSHLSVDPSSNNILEDALERNVMVCQVKTSRGWREIDSETLSKKWMISPEIARQTLL